MKIAMFNNAVKTPMPGYGVYQGSPEDCERSVTDALKVETVKWFMSLVS